MGRKRKSKRKMQMQMSEYVFMALYLCSAFTPDSPFAMYFNFISISVPNKLVYHPDIEIEINKLSLPLITILLQLPSPPP